MSVDESKHLVPKGYFEEFYFRLIIIFSLRIWISMSHKKCDLVCVEFSNFDYYVIFIHFQAAVSALLAASVLYVGIKIKINIT
jgi:hypothetical protein